MYHDPMTDPPAASPTPDPDAGATGTSIAGWATSLAETSQPDHPEVCPFLRSIDDDDELGAPIQAPDPANRCVAIDGPVPQSLRQQELVCLARGHVNCPRYLRGSVVEPTVVEILAGRTFRSLTPATAAALLALAASCLLSVAFAVSNGGLVLTAATTASPSGGVLAAENTASPTATAAPTPSPSPTPTASPTATPSPSPSPTPSPTPSPSPTPALTATPKSTTTPKPTSDRYVLLKACPDKSNCWIYVIRSGDNLYSIANYFGVSLSAVRSMNPWTATGGLTVGRQLRIPTPTR